MVLQKLIYSNSKTLFRPSKILGNNAAISILQKYTILPPPHIYIYMRVWENISLHIMITYIITYYDQYIITYCDQHKGKTDTRIYVVCK